MVFADTATLTKSQRHVNILADQCQFSTLNSDKSKNAKANDRHINVTGKTKRTLNTAKKLINNEIYITALAFIALIFLLVAID